MSGTNTIAIDLAKATADQINESFTALVAELDELNALVKESGANPETNARAAELDAAINEHRSAYVAATTVAPVTDVSPLAAPAAEVTELTAEQIAEAAAVVAASDDALTTGEAIAAAANLTIELTDAQVAEITAAAEELSLDDEPELTAEQIAEDAARAHKASTPGTKNTPKPAVKRASIMRASRTSDGTGNDYGTALETPQARATHINKASKNRGPILGHQQWDRDIAESNGVLLKAGMSEVQFAEVFERVRRCEVHGVHRSSCGCVDPCMPAINEQPLMFCDPSFDEILDWITDVPMDGCMVKLWLPEDYTPWDVNQWGYCVDTGEVDENGDPVYAGPGRLDPETGQLVKEGGWDPLDPTTFKTPQTIDDQCFTARYFQLVADYIAVDVSRKQRLCNAAMTDRFLGFMGRDLRRAEAKRIINTMWQNALTTGYAYEGVGAGLNFADGFLGLIADESDGLLRDKCIDLSQYDAFIMNGSEKWLRQEGARSLKEGLDGVAVLEECFNSVRFTSCLPEGVEPAASYTGAPDAVTELTPADCERELCILLAHRDKWARGRGEDHSLVLDRGDRHTALANGEFHFLETENVTMPIDMGASLTMKFTLNNKGMLAGVAEPCA